MTAFTAAQLAKILSALSGSARHPNTKAAARKAIDRIAKILSLTSEAVLAAAPALLDGRLDPASWREQLTAPVQPSSGERIAASLRIAFFDLPEWVEIIASGEQAVLIDRYAGATMLTADSDDAATHARWRKAIGKIARQDATPDSLPAPLEAPEEEDRTPDAEGGAQEGRVVRIPRPGSKQALVVGLLGREQGATLDELAAATGWLPHTTRAALTDLRRRGYSLHKGPRDGRGRSYSIQAA